MLLRWRKAKLDVLVHKLKRKKTFWKEGEQQMDKE